MSETNVSQSSTMTTTQSFSIWEGDAIQLEICNLCQKTFEHSADEFQKFCEACRRDLEEFVDDERSLSMEEEHSKMDSTPLIQMSYDKSGINPNEKICVLYWCCHCASGTCAKNLRRVPCTAIEINICCMKLRSRRSRPEGH